MKKIFEWISKHFSILQAVFTICAPKILSLIFPFLRLQLSVSMWMIISLICVPFSLYSLYSYLISSRVNKFNIGDRVVPKNTSGLTAYYIVGYSVFKKGHVTIKKLDGVKIRFHENSLDLYDFDKHGKIL